VSWARGGVACFFVESRNGKADMAREKVVGIDVVKHVGGWCARLWRRGRMWCVGGCGAWEDVVRGLGSRDGP
jgi:hypothetical protein